jgi:hypothetical protein
VRARKPPEPAAIRYFVDRCLGAHIVPKALRAQGMDLITLAEAGYEHDAEDAEWIPKVAGKGWVILTKDKRIRLDSLELGAALASRAYYFTLGGGNYTGAEMADIILYHRSTIERLVRHRQPPIVAQLNRAELLLRAADGSLHPVKRRGG